MEFEGSNFIHSNENVYKILNIDIKLNKDILYNIEEVLKDYSNLKKYKLSDVSLGEILFKSN